MLVSCTERLVSTTERLVSTTERLVSHTQRLVSTTQRLVLEWVGMVQVAVRSHFGLRLGGRNNPDSGASNRILGSRIIYKIIYAIRAVVACPSRAARSAVVVSMFPNTMTYFFYFRPCDNLSAGSTNRTHYCASVVVA